MATSPGKAQIISFSSSHVTWLSGLNAGDFTFEVIQNLGEFSSFEMNFGQLLQEVIVEEADEGVW